MATATNKESTRFSSLKVQAMRTDANGIAKVPLTVKGVLGQTADLFRALDSTGAVLSSIDISGNHIVGGATNVSRRVTQTLISAAQIISMFTTPVAVVAAPAAGTVIVVNQIMVELNLTATAFSGGGVVHFYYHGQTVELMSATLAAATINGGAAQTIWILQPVATAGGSVGTKEVGIDITCATGVFAAGTGTAKVTVWYNVVTLG